MSILIFVNVVAGIPAGGAGVLSEGGKVEFGVMVLLTLVLLVWVVFMEQGQRRIPVTFAKRVVGRRTYGGSSTYIPLKVNQSGVIPIIFASSLLYIPVLLSNLLPSTSFRTFVNDHIQPTNYLYVVVYGILIFAFTFFYVYVAFDPHQQADILRKQGGFIPASALGRPPSGTCPGSSTASPSPVASTWPSWPSPPASSWRLGTSPPTPTTGRRCSSPSGLPSRP